MATSEDQYQADIAKLTSVKSLSENWVHIDFADNKLKSRKPEYHRLDVRFTALSEFWGLNWTFYLDVINAYNKSNIIAYNYYVNSDLTLGREANTMFPIIPTLGFSVKF